MKRFFLFIAIAFFSIQVSFAQVVSNEIVTKTIKDIKTEALNKPQTIEYTSYLSDVIGERVTWSPGFNKSIDWAVNKLSEIGLSNSHAEEWEPIGKSWNVKRNIVNQTSPYFSNLIAMPKHFSPGTNGLIKGKAVYMDARTEADFEKYKGKLKGAIVFTSVMPNIRINYDPLVTRYKDDEIKKFEDALMPTAEEKKKETETKEANEKATVGFLQFLNKRIEFCMNEGAVAIVDHGGKLYGTIQGLSALLPTPLKSIDELFYVTAMPNAVKTLPQLLLSIEQYNSIVRTLKNGIDVNLEINIEVESNNTFKGKNVVAEIPGTDLKNEIVMIGAHIDTQGPSIGAVDNAVGVAVCMEAMRILKQIGAQPRRTIRIGLWGGEEQGYLGSKAYVEEHFVKNKNEKGYMYFNTDNGAGRFRGLYMEERSDLVATMKSWFEKIDMKLISTISKTSNTDHVPFNDKGIPGFQFIQDPLDYFRMYHTNMDRVERIPMDDVRDNAIIMACLAYLAAIE